MIIHGIHIMNGVDKDWSFAKIIALAPIKAFENAKVKVQGSGLSCNTDAQGKPDFPNIDFAYAKRLVDTQAFVTGKDYEIKMDLDLDTLKPTITELIPTDHAVLKHFNDCMGIK